jgi:aspartate/methionine/tyrosine aminotransferase
MNKTKLKNFDYPDGSLISFMSNKVKKNGGINLAQGIPAYKPPIELMEILQTIAFDNIHQYPPGTGDIDLVNQIVQHYKKENEQLSAEHLLITQGATEAIYLIYQYLKNEIKGDFSVLAFDPLYESYKYLPQILNNRLHISDYSALDDQNFLEFKQKISEENVKLIFIASPGNPHGVALKKEFLRRLTELAEEMDFYIVFDAVYKDLCFKKPAFIPLSPLSKKVFYVNSFSKMLSITGWRIGYFFCDSDHMHKIRSIHDYTGLCAPSILQRAIALYLKKYDYGNIYLGNLRRRLSDSFELLSENLKKSGIEIPPVDGGYFVWGKLPEKFPNGFQWAMNLYEQQKVAVIPGIHFSEKGDRFVRFNIARETSEIEEAGKRIMQFCEEL